MILMVLIENVNVQLLMHHKKNLINEVTLKHSDFEYLSDVEISNVILLNW